MVLNIPQSTGQRPAPWQSEPARNASSAAIEKPALPKGFGHRGPQVNPECSVTVQSLAPSPATWVPPLPMRQAAGHP